MITRDFLHLTTRSIRDRAQRSRLTALGIAIGIAAVVLLTSIGEGIHRFVLAEFTQFGTHIIGINPGKTTTHGASIGVFGTERPLTIQDAIAIEHLPRVEAVVPIIQGNAEIKGGGRSRRTTVYGVGPAMPEAFQFNVALGQFLPAEDDPRSPRAFAVLGSKLKHELYGTANPLGSIIRVGGHRFRVIGAMASKGQLLGFDLDDTLYIPAERARQIFNRTGLIEIDVLYAPEANEDEVVASLRRLLTARHGRDDVTITTQQQMLDVLGSILDVLTLAVAALGGISLLVGGIGILTIMTIAVTERTNEIGLLRSLGATRRQIIGLFLGEAVILSLLGGLLGLGLGISGVLALGFSIPALPVEIAWQYVFLALGISLLLGLGAGIVPASRAAAMDPVAALRTE